MKWNLNIGFLFHQQEVSSEINIQDINFPEGLPQNSVITSSLTQSLSSTEAPLSEVSAGAGKKAAAGLAAGASARCHTQYGHHPGEADFLSFPYGGTVVYVFYTEVRWRLPSNLS